MSFIITNGTSYCHQTRNRAVQIVETESEATKFKDELTAQKLLARATKKLKGYEVVEISGDHTKEAAPHSAENHSHAAAPADQKNAAASSEIKEEKKAAVGKNTGRQNTDRQNKDKQDADKRDADRQDADRRDADKQNADRRDADRRDADKQNADRRDADKQNADRRDADKQNADKRDANHPDAAHEEARSGENADTAAPQKKNSRRGRPRKVRSAEPADETAHDEKHLNPEQSSSPKDSHSGQNHTGSNENRRTRGKAEIVADSRKEIVERENSDVTVQNHFTMPVIRVVTKHAGTPSTTPASSGAKIRSESADIRDKSDRKPEPHHSDAAGQAEDKAKASAKAKSPASSVTVPKFTVVTHTSGQASNNKKPGNAVSREEAEAARSASDISSKSVDMSSRNVSSSVDMNSGRRDVQPGASDGGNIPGSRGENSRRQEPAETVSSAESETASAGSETGNRSDSQRNSGRGRNHTRGRRGRYQDRNGSAAPEETSSHETDVNSSHAEKNESSASREIQDMNAEENTSATETSAAESPEENSGYEGSRSRRGRRSRYGSRRRGSRRSREDFPDVDETVDLSDTRDDKGHVTHPVPRRLFTQRERQMVYNSTEGHCGICGRFIPLGEYTIDHIIPLSKGGTNDLSNLQPCCSFCNKAKDDSMGDEFFDRIERIYMYQAQLKYSKKKFRKFKKAIKDLKSK